MHLVAFDRVSEQFSSITKPILLVVPTPTGKYHVALIQYCMRTAQQPVQIAVSVDRKQYAYECLQQANCFHLVFPSTNMAPIMAKLADEPIDSCVEVATLGSASFAGRYQKLPIFRDATINLELELVTQIRTGDHMLYVGEVKYAWAAE